MHRQLTFPAMGYKFLSLVDFAREQIISGSF